MNTDLSSLFMPRQPAMGSEEAVCKNPFTLSDSDLASRWVIKNIQLGIHIEWQQISKKYFTITSAVAWCKRTLKS